MLVGELMSKNVIAIDKNRALSDALRLIKKRRISRVVVTSDGKLYGILTVSDISRHVGSSKHGKILPSSLHISTAMTANPKTIDAGKSIRDAARLMLEHNISSLPVVDCEKIVGIITKTDLIKVLTNSKKRLKDVMGARFETIGPKDRVVHARRLMIDKKISRVVVIEEEQLVGVLTEKDIAKALSAFRKAADKYQYSRVRNMLVEDIMTRIVKTLETEAKVGEAVKLMLENYFSGVPIMCKGKCVGIVTKMDLLKII